MNPIHDTAYPILPAEPSAAELKTAFTPTATEIRFVRRQSRQESTSVLILIQLKLLQRLGYFPMMVDVPFAIIDHVRAALRVRSLPRSTVTRYDVSGTRARHQKLLRTHVNIQQVDAGAQECLETLALAAAQTKVELPDIVNVLIEELIRRRYELPPLAVLQRIATQARSQINKTIYRGLAVDGGQNPTPDGGVDQKCETIPVLQGSPVLVVDGIDGRYRVRRKEPEGRVQTHPTRLVSGRGDAGVRMR